VRRVALARAIRVKSFLSGDLKNVHASGICQLLQPGYIAQYKELYARPHKRPRNLCMDLSSAKEAGTGFHVARVS